MATRDFYVALGNLFFSVYQGDSLREFMDQQPFFDQIKSVLIPLEKEEDEFGTNKSFYCIFEMERLIDEKVNPCIAFQTFEEYYKDHQGAFPSQYVEKVDDLMGRLASMQPEGKADSYFKKYRALKKGYRNKQNSPVK